MADTKQGTGRKYEAPSAEDTTWLPDLTGVGPIVNVVDRGTEDLDAVYYDTDDLRLPVPRPCSGRGRAEPTDTALHEARKAAKKTRYATEPARDVLGKPAKRLGKRAKACCTDRNNLRPTGANASCRRCGPTPRRDPRKTLT
ncbi:CHAD domain-containing protein [Streptomyces sp. NPDC005811]|uniref:CHAD domain-containing protein n=1 Tax=Streptomyces sp. NPDC005811 TaxID=3154565 RepID=UPI0033C0CB29